MAEFRKAHMYDYIYIYTHLSRNKFISRAKLRATNNGCVQNIYGTFQLEAHINTMSHDWLSNREFFNSHRFFYLIANCVTMCLCVFLIGKHPYNSHIHKRNKRLVIIERD